MCTAALPILRLTRSAAFQELGILELTRPFTRGPRVARGSVIIIESGLAVEIHVATVDYFMSCRRPSKVEIDI